MSASPYSGDDPLRDLLALETFPAPEFLERARVWCGADALLLLAADAAGALRVVHHGGLRADVAAAVEAACLDPGAHPLLFSLGEGCHLQTGDLCAVPLARFFPDARWCLLVAGAGWASGAVWFGAAAPPPAAVASDPLLGRQLLRMVADRVGTAPDASVAASEALARLSHEFKTPLVSIKGYAELILDQDGGSLDPRVRQWVARIAGGANRLAGLFRKATAEARTDAADSYEARPVDPVEWVRRCVEETRSLARGRDLRWEWTAADGVPHVWVDPEASRDLLLELLQNAARATPDGGRVAVEIAGVDRDLRPGVQVSVADSGVGFPGGTEAEALFRRFTTSVPVIAHHSGEFEFGAGGLGLGLPMARGIARAHGGELWAEGRGRDPRNPPGSVFRVWLPRAEIPRMPAGEADVPGRVLVLEPDPQPRQILAEALGESHQVVAVSSAEEARTAWAEGEWVACVLEPRVPGGGAALVAELRALPGAAAAAILTYSTAAAASETAAWRAAGADSCVAKPARARVLLQRLRTVRNRRNRR